MTSWTEYAARNPNCLTPGQHKALMETPGSTIGLRLRRERFKRDLSLSEVADRAGIAKSYLHKIEEGTVENPGIKTLLALCNAIGYPLTALVEGL